MLNKHKIAEENIIFLGIINSLDEYYSINNTFPFEEIDVLEEIEQYNEKIITITEEEIKEHFGSYKDIKELREKAIKYFADNIQGKTFDIGKYKNIRITRKARNKYESFSADERKLLIVPKLLKILETSKYQKSEEPYKTRIDKIIKFHYFTNKIVLKNNSYEVYITIAEDIKGNLFYDLDENKETLGRNIGTSDVSLRHK